MTSWLLRSIGTAAALALVLFAIVAERTRERGSHWLRESDRAFDAGHLELAVQHARAAATAYVPGAEHVDLAFARLRAIARRAQRVHDLELSNTAWRAMRAAAIESRHLWQPHPDELREADRELARSSDQTSEVEGSSIRVPLGLLLGAACAALGFWGLLGRETAETGEGQVWVRPALLCLLGIAIWTGVLLVA